MHNDLKTQVKTAAHGNWQSIISSISGIDTTVLNGKHHPCPLCLGKDRFRFLNYEDTGGAMCNQCSPSMGDGIAVIQWLCNMSFREALETIASHLNIEFKTKKPAKTKKTPAKSQFTNVNKKQVGFTLYTKNVAAITVQSLIDNDAESATLNSATTVIRLPIHNLKLETQGYISRNVTGKPIVKYHADGTTTAKKSMASKGAKPGLMGAYAIRNIADADIVWKVEGETDMLALHGAISELPPEERIKHVVVASSFGASYSAKYTQILPLFRSKHVIIIGDNDKDGTGARGAQDWAAQIKIPATDVKILPLPEETKDSQGETQHIKDVRDFLSAGGTFTDLLAIATTTPEIPGEDADVIAIKKTETQDNLRKITNSDTIGREFVAQYNNSSSNADNTVTFVYRAEKFYFYLHASSDPAIINTSTTTTARKINCWQSVEVPYMERLIRRYAIKYLEGKTQDARDYGDDEAMVPNINRTLISDVLAAVKSYAYMSSSIQFNQIIESDIHDNILGTGEKYYLAMESNILAVPAKAGDLIRTSPHSSSWFSQNILGYDYTKEEDIPEDTHLFNFFASSFAGRTDNINLLLEYMAYTLFIPDCRHEKILFLDGVSRGGKGVCTTLFRALIGSHNCSEISLKDCGKGPRVALLEGKLLNISEEESGFIDSETTGYAKIIASGEPILIEEKYRAPRTIQPSAKWLCTTNEFPTIKDRSEAFWNRLMIIKFSNTIPAEARNPKYKTVKYWLESGEMPKLFGAVLNAYRNIMRRGAFIVPAGMADLVIVKQDISNPIQMALKELYFRSSVPGRSIVKARLHEKIRAWLRDNGHREYVTTTNINTGVENVFGSLRETRPRIPGENKPRSFSGICDRTEWLPEEVEEESAKENNKNTSQPEENLPPKIDFIDENLADGIDNIDENIDENSDDTSFNFGSQDG